MVYNSILMETIGISVMVSIGLLSFFFIKESMLNKYFLIVHWPNYCQKQSTVLFRNHSQNLLTDDFLLFI